MIFANNRGRRETIGDMCLIHCFARSRDHRARGPINQDPEMTRKSPGAAVYEPARRTVRQLGAGLQIRGSILALSFQSAQRRRRRLADRSRREARVCTRRVYACERAGARLELVD